MRFALTTSLRLAKDNGCFGVLTHPTDDPRRAVCRRFSFEDLPFDIAELERNGLRDRGA